VTLDPTREGFLSLAADAEPTVVRTVADLPADVDPLAAYAALTRRTTGASDGEYTFLLESAEKVASSDPDGAFAPAGGDRHARFSFVGYDPAAAVTVGPDGTAVEILDDRYDGLIDPAGGDAVDRLRGALPDVTLRGFPDRGRRHLDGGLVGFLSYDAVYDLRLDEVGVERPASRYPDAQFVLTTKTLAFDHAEGTLSLVFTPVVRPEDGAGALYDDLQAEAGRVADLLAAADGVETGGFRRDREKAGSRDEYEAAV